MPQRQLNTINLGNRLGEIKCSIEMLTYGVSELEALYSRIKSGAVIAENERVAAKENAKVLNANNHCLAHAINKALKEVESNIKTQTASGKVIDEDTMIEFSTVLKQSIRTLQLYCAVHETYQQYHQNSTSLSDNTNLPVTSTSKKSKRKGAHKKDLDPDSMSTCQKFRRLMKTICICGASHNNASSQPCNN